MCQRLTYDQEETLEYKTKITLHTGVTNLRFIVKMRKDGFEKIADQRWLIVGGGIEGDEGDASHLKVGIL